MTFENVTGLSIAAVFAVSLLAMLREKFKDDRVAQTAREAADRELSRERAAADREERAIDTARELAERELARERIAADLQTSKVLRELAEAIHGLTHHVYELRQDVGGVTPPLGSPITPPPAGDGEATKPSGPYSSRRKPTHIR